MSPNSRNSVNASNIIPSYLVSENNMMLMYSVDTASPEVSREYGRIVGLLWLCFATLGSVAMASFYGFTYVYIGVPSPEILGAYFLLVVLSFLTLAAFIIGMQTLYNKTQMHHRFICAYNTFLVLILLLSMVITLLFAQDVSRSNLVKYLSSSQIGTETFVHFIENKFKCCGLLSEDLQNKLYYEHNETTVGDTSITFAVYGCQMTHEKGCLDNITNLHSLLKSDKSLYSMFLFQQFLPVLVVIGVIILIMLFNTYVKDFKAAESEEIRQNQKNLKLSCPSQGLGFGSIGSLNMNTEVPLHPHGRSFPISLSSDVHSNSYRYQREISNRIINGWNTV